LAERKDRRGSGLVRFTSAAVLAQGGNGGAPQTGAGLTVTITLLNPAPSPVRDLDVAIGIDTANGERLTALTTQAVSSTVGEVAPGHSVVDFHIGKVPFAPGRYSLTLFASNALGVVDWVEAALSFNVEPGDFFGTGRSIPAGQGSILVDYGVTYLHGDCKSAPSRAMS
jgi:lipopolysaccharide transport system ATP-binding protein